jgi:hypothetical protein
VTGKPTEEAPYKTGYDLMIIALVAFRGKFGRDPAFVEMNPDFYARMVNDLRPEQSFDPLSMTVAGIPLKFASRRLSFSLEGKE